MGLSRPVMGLLYLNLLYILADPSVRSLAGNAGSIHSGGMDVSLVSVVSCQVEISALD
jgi:hypothetical protein